MAPEQLREIEEAAVKESEPNRGRPTYGIPESPMYSCTASRNDYGPAIYSRIYWRPFDSK